MSTDLINVIDKQFKQSMETATFLLETINEITEMAVPLYGDGHELRQFKSYLMEVIQHRLKELSLTFDRPLFNVLEKPDPTIFGGVDVGISEREGELDKLSNSNREK